MLLLWLKEMIKLKVCFFVFLSLPFVLVGQTGEEQGNLNEVEGSPFQTGSSPLGIAFAPTSTTSLALTDVANGSEILDVYNVNPETGELNTPTEYSIVSSPYMIAYSPSFPSTNSTYAFAGVTHQSSESESADGFTIYQVNMSTNVVFTELQNYTLAQATTIAFSPYLLGQLFVAVASSTTLTFYSVNTATGACTVAGTISLPTGYTNPSVAFSPLFTTASSSLYYAIISLASTTSDSGVLLVYPFTFNLTTGAAVVPTTATQTISLEIAPGSIDISPSLYSSSTSYAFAAITDRNASDGENGVYLYQVSGNSTPLTQISTGIGITGSNPVGVSFSPLFPSSSSSSLNLAVANFGSNNISVFNVNTSSGALTEMTNSPFSAGTAPIFLDYSSYFTSDNKNHMYLAATNAKSNNISVYRVNLVGSPTDVSGFQQADTSFTITTGTPIIRAKKSPKINYANVLNWDSPRFGSGAIILYRIYKKTKHRRILLAEIPSDNPTFTHSGCKPCSKTHYLIRSVDLSGQMSPPVGIKIMGNKFVKLKAKPKKKKVNLQLLPCS